LQLANTFALCRQKAIHVLPGEHGEILGRLEVGYREKVAFWRTKAAISLKRVKIEESYYGRPIGKELTNALSKLFRTVPSTTPYGLPFPKIGGSQPPL